jgi:hypothetical protein
MTIPTIRGRKNKLPGVLHRRLAVGCSDARIHRQVDARDQARIVAREECHHCGDALLLRTYALTLRLWQTLSYPAALRSLLLEPGLRGLDRDFGTELEGAVAAL